MFFSPSLTLRRSKLVCSSLAKFFTLVEYFIVRLGTCPRSWVPYVAPLGSAPALPSEFQSYLRLIGPSNSLFSDRTSDEDKTFYNMDTRRLVHAQGEKGPSPRYGHSAVMHDDKVCSQTYKLHFLCVIGFFK